MYNKQDTIKKIEEFINGHDIILFMKGTKKMPACGFSAMAVQILQTMNIDFTEFNIFDNQEWRELIKEYANWPTYPQLWVKGELIGGCDIMKEMFHSGELKNLFIAKNIITE